MEGTYACIWIVFFSGLVLIELNIVKVRVILLVLIRFCLEFLLSDRLFVVVFVSELIILVFLIGEVILSGAEIPLGSSVSGNILSVPGNVPSLVALFVLAEEHVEVESLPHLNATLYVFL